MCREGRRGTYGDMLGNVGVCSFTPMRQRLDVEATFKVIE